MKKYKIAIVGLGSIGKRHLMNIDKVLREREIDYSIDIIRRLASPVDEQFKILISNIYSEEEYIQNDYDVIFITNPTHLHYDTIRKYSKKTKSMFIEKPIFDDTSINIKNLTLSENGIYYIACPLRYTEVIQYIKNKIDLSHVYSVRAICSSFLPEWRPDLDYRNTYSAHLEQGGGVSIDLIHEWDYMIYLFGKPSQIMNYRGKFSNLDINSDDLSIYIAKYENMLAELHLDYFGKRTIRELQLFTKDETIEADIANSEIRFLREDKIIKFSEERNSYQVKEIEYFFDLIEGKKKNENDIYIALDTLKIAKEGKI